MFRETSAMFRETSAMFREHRGCSIITSRIVDGWISAFFVMLRDRKRAGEWYRMKGCHVTVKKIKKPFFVLLSRDGNFINIRHGIGKFTYINSHSVFVIILYLRSFLYKVVH